MFGWRVHSFFVMEERTSGDSLRWRSFLHHANILQPCKTDAPQNQISPNQMMNVPATNVDIVEVDAGKGLATAKVTKNPIAAKNNLCAGRSEMCL
jgi:hypothetical protein